MSAYTESRSERLKSRWSTVLSFRSNLRHTACAITLDGRRQAASYIHDSDGQCYGQLTAWSGAQIEKDLCRATGAVHSCVRTGVSRR